MCLLFLFKGVAPGAPAVPSGKTTPSPAHLGCGLCTLGNNENKVGRPKSWAFAREPGRRSEICVVNFIAFKKKSIVVGSDREGCQLHQPPRLYLTQRIY